MAAISYISNGPAASFTTSTAVNVSIAAAIVPDDLLVVVFGFEGVASGSGPWVSGTPMDGWSRTCYQAPAGTGSGIEVWSANFGFGGFTTFNFFASMSGIAREAAYRCPGAGGPHVEHTATAQHTGDNPVCPDLVTTRPDTMIMRCAAMELAAPGFVFPAPVTERWDNARASTFGNVEACHGDVNQPVAGSAGTYTITATSAGGADEGATVTLGVICTEKRVQLPFAHCGP